MNCFELNEKYNANLIKFQNIWKCLAKRGGAAPKLDLVQPLVKLLNRNKC